MLSNQYTRKAVTFVVLSICAVMFSSCDKYLTSKKEDKRILEVNAVELSCLKTLPERFQRILRSEMLQDDLSSISGCFENSVRSFKQKTQGAQQNAYSYQELIRFFNHYFLQQNQISDSLGLALMQFKKGLFGGDDKLITYQELDHLVAWVKSLEEPMRQLQPHMSLVLMQRDPMLSERPTIADVKESLMVFENTIVNIVKNTQLWQSQYGFEQGYDLLEKMSTFTQNYFSEEQSQKIKNLLPVLPLLKNILVKRGRYLTAEEFEVGTRSFVRAYGVIVQHKYLKKTDQLVGTLGDVRTTSHLALEVARVLETSPAMVSYGEIELEEIKKLLIKVVDPKAPVISWKLEVEPAMDALKVILAKIFDDQQAIPLDALKSIKPLHLYELKREAMIVRTVSQILEDAFRKIGSVIVMPENQDVGVLELLDEYPMFLSGLQLQPELETYGLQNEESVIRGALNQFPQLLRKNYVLQYDQAKSILIAGNHIPVKFTMESVAKVLSMNALTRLLLLGYASSSNTSPLAERTLKIEDMRQWYEDFRTFGVSIKAFDPRSENSGPRSFYEANFFTFSGNGDDFMSYDETYELVSFLFSAGLVGADLLRHDLEQDKCEVETLDIFGKKLVKRDCLMKVWKAKAHTLFANLPGMAQFIQSLDAAQFREYFELLEVGAIQRMENGVVQNHPEFYDTSDLRSLVAVTHYIESIYTNFDLNHDQILQFSEVRPASSRFLSFILKIVEKNAPAWLAGPQLAQIAYEFLVVNGRQPTGASEIASFWIQDKSAFTANRMHIFKVFTVVRASLGK